MAPARRRGYQVVEKLGYAAAALVMVLLVPGWWILWAVVFLVSATAGIREAVTCLRARRRILDDNSLRERKGPIALDDAAGLIARGILDCALECAEKLKVSYKESRGTDPSSPKLSKAAFDGAIAEYICLLVHFADYLAFHALGQLRRHELMQRVANLMAGTMVEFLLVDNQLEKEKVRTTVLEALDATSMYYGNLRASCATGEEEGDKLIWGFGDRLREITAIHLSPAVILAGYTGALSSLENINVKGIIERIG